MAIRAAPPTEEGRADPSIFVIPRYLRWDERTQAQPELLAAARHQRPIRELTRIVIHGPGLPSAVPAVQTLVAQSIVEFAHAEQHLLELHFDQRRQDILDARPTLPLIIRY